MEVALVVASLVSAALLSVLLSTLTYGLREYSRAKLAVALEKRTKDAWLEATVEHAGDLAVVTAIGRLVLNLVVLLLALHLVRDLVEGPWAGYGLALLAGGTVALFCSVLVPHALAQHGGEAFIATFVRPLHAGRLALLPVLKVLHLTDGLVRRATNKSADTDDDRIEGEIEAEIVALAEEGEERGVVDERERQMIQRVIGFRATAAGQVMTARPAVVALPITATLAEVQALLERTGHSRVPVYDGTLDEIKGVLYARDLIPQVGRPADAWSIRSAMRPAFFVPEFKPLRDLLQDFRLQKVHLAVVRDEYGATSGLVTIEDLLEELVGEISDEHEPLAEAQFKRLDDRSAEADAKLHVDELNRLLGLDLPEDEGYETVGGFVSAHLGRIPEAGTTFDYGGATFTVVGAEPQRVNRLRIELPPSPDGAGASTAA